MQFLCYSPYLGHHYNQESLFRCVNEPVLCTKVGPPPGTNRQCLSPILSGPPDHPDFRHTDWAKFQTHLEDQIPFNPELPNEMAIDTYGENFYAAVLKALTVSIPRVAFVRTHGLRYRLAFRTRYTWRTGCGDRDRSPGTPFWDRWHTGSTCGGTTSVARHPSASIPKTSHCEGWSNDDQWVPTSSPVWVNRSHRLWESGRPSW